MNVLSFWKRALEEVATQPVTRVCPGRPRKPRQHTKRLAEFTDPDEIRLRLAVLRAKQRRACRYDASVRVGHPDMDLLDEKQRELLVYYTGANLLFPVVVHRSLTNTVRVLARRLALHETNKPGRHGPPIPGETVTARQEHSNETASGGPRG